MALLLRTVSTERQLSLFTRLSTSMCWLISGTVDSTGSRWPCSSLSNRELKEWMHSWVHV